MKIEVKTPNSYTVMVFGGCCAKLRLKTLCEDIYAGARISQYWCWRDPGQGDSKSDLDFMHWWLTVHIFVNVYPQLNAETVAAHVMHVQAICKELSSWPPLILYMHPLDDVTHIKLVDIVDFTHIYQAYMFFWMRVSDVLFRRVSVSDILRSCSSWHCLWHWTWVCHLNTNTTSVRARWCTSKPINADQRLTLVESWCAHLWCHLNWALSSWFLT